MASLYKHVLLATDLSDHSDYVAKRAVDIANAANAKLSVVHVMAHTSIAYAGEFSIPIDAEFEATLKAQTQAQLKKLGVKYCIPENEQYLMDGSVKSGVTKLAGDLKADLIVVGTHGHTGIDVLIGSQANAILHAAKCDVWVIRIK